MKFLEKLALIVFSIIILIIAVVCCLVVFQVVEFSDITNFISEQLQNETVSRVIVGVSIVCIILAIKSLFFPARRKKREEIKSGVLLENQDGRLLISKDTIENLVNSVVRSFPDAMDTQTKIFLDTENNVTVFVSLLVREEAIIKQLSSNIQNKIKETVKRNTDLDVKQVNINVKNIENDKNDKSEKNKKEVTKKENNTYKTNLNNVKIAEDKKVVEEKQENVAIISDEIKSESKEENTELQ